MKSTFLSNKKSIYFPLRLLFLFIFLSTSLTAFAQTPQLSLVDLFTALRSKKATMPEKNKLLADGVKQRGITFLINKNLEKELRNAGANDNLIQAIRKKNPTPKLKVEPTPKPASTPKPKDFSYYQNRANSSFVLGKYDQAIENYTKAVELNDKKAEIFISRGLAFYNNKKFNLAVNDFDKAIELDPKESMAYYNRGNAFQQMGELEKAQISYKKALEINSKNELAKEAFENLQSDLETKSQPQNNKTIDETLESKKSNKILNKTKPNKFFYIGSLQKIAVKLVTPVYPSFERKKNTTGLVTVKITIDKKGKVVSANAINGPKGLRKPSENAARRSKFKPHKVKNTRVKASGFITYNFKLD